MYTVILVEWQLCGHKVSESSTDNHEEVFTSPCPYCEIERLRKELEIMTDKYYESKGHI